MPLYNHLLGKGLTVIGLPVRYRTHSNYNSIFRRFTTSTCLRQPTNDPFRI